MCSAVMREYNQVGAGAGVGALKVYTIELKRTNKSASKLVSCRIYI